MAQTGKGLSMFRYALAATFTTMALVSPALADDHMDHGVVQTVDTADLQGVVQSLGHTVVSVGPVPGDPKYPTALTAADPAGQQYHLIATACDIPPVRGCRGIMMQVRYPRPDGVTETTLMRTSRRQAALNLWFNEAGDILGMTRYVVLDRGVTPANIAENVKVLLTLAPIAREQAMQDVDEEGEVD